MQKQLQDCSIQGNKIDAYTNFQVYVYNPEQ